MLFWCTIFAVELGWIEDSHDLLLSDSGGAYNDDKVWSYLNPNGLSVFIVFVCLFRNSLEAAPSVLMSWNQKQVPDYMRPHSKD